MLHIHNQFYDQYVIINYYYPRYFYAIKIYLFFSAPSIGILIGLWNGIELIKSDEFDLHIDQ